MFGRVAKVTSIFCSCYQIYCVKIIFTYCLLSYIHVFVPYDAGEVLKYMLLYILGLRLQITTHYQLLEIGDEEQGGSEGKSEDSVSAADWEILLDTGIEGIHARKKEKAKNADTSMMNSEI